MNWRTDSYVTCGPPQMTRTVRAESHASFGRNPARTTFKKGSMGGKQNNSLSLVADQRRFQGSKTQARCLNRRSASTTTEVREGSPYFSWADALDSCTRPDVKKNVRPSSESNFKRNPRTTYFELQTFKNAANYHASTHQRRCDDIHPPQK